MSYFGDVVKRKDITLLKSKVSSMSKSCDDMTTPPNSSLVLSGQKAFEKLVIVMCEHLTLSTPPNSSLALSGRSRNS
jgi:hypothetical protein